MKKKLYIVCIFIYNMHYIYFYRYAECIRTYICKFLQCNIKPIVVCDGGLEKSERKMKTIFKRIYKRFKNVKDIAKNKRNNKQVLPILSHNVFISVLNELNVPLVMSDYEADSQIAALANHYKCPVIGEDCDFFIFNVHDGFIIRDSIEIDVILEIDSNGQEHKYLNCYIYNVNEFVSCFPGIKKAVLPLFATLMGNDYIERAEFDNFFENIQLPIEEKIISLLKWLKGKSLDDAISQILEYLDKEKLEYVKSLLQNSIASYNFHGCSLQPIVDQKLNDIKCELLFDSGLSTPCGNSLPSDFLVKYHNGQFPSLFPNIIVAHKCFLMPQIDDFSFCSSYMCARYIRRVIYGILTSHDVDGQPCQNEKCLAPVDEYDRHETRIDKELVEPIFIIEGFGMLPKINELNNLRKETAKLIVKKVLGLKLGFVKDLPDEWRLFLGSINYCICNTVPCFTEAFLYAIILNLIYCDIIIHKNPYQNVSVYCKKCTNGNGECTSISCTLQKIKELDWKQAAKNLTIYLSEPNMNKMDPLYVKILHSYSQLQSSVLGVVSLNKLLGTCYKNPDIHKYLNGSMIYNLAKDIFTCSDPTLFVAGILGRETTLFKLFALLNLKVHHRVPHHYVLKNATFHRKKT